jgi:cathepsin L
MLTKLSIAALLATAVAAGRLTHEKLATYTFEQYVQDYRHPWTPGSTEWKTREQVFNVEINRIRAHNEDSTKSWKETVNHFTAMTAAEKKASLGYSKGKAHNHKPKFEKKLPADFVVEPLSKLPKSVDWRAKDVVSAVKDQGHCGSCWAFASTATLESHAAINSGKLYELSVQQMAMCAPNPDHCGGVGACGGSTAELAFDYVAGSTGMVHEFHYSYAAYAGTDSACSVPDYGTPVVTIDGYVHLPQNNYTALMNAVAKVGPISINVDASNWHSYSTGIFNGCSFTENVDINHVVVLVGYGEEQGTPYWLVRNSWSPSYGEAGYIRVLRSDSDDTNCGTDSTPTDGIECEGSTDPIKVCGVCGVIYDSAYPSGVAVAGF